MYVSQLDRPWLETPFLFQGFFVDSDEVLARLREYCECVFVDDERSEEVASIPSRSPSALRNADAPKPKQAPSKVLALTAATDDDSAMLKTEILTARRAHDTANRVAKLLYENIRAGEAIEFDLVSKSLDPMLDSIMRNDDALAWLTRMQKMDDYVYSHSVASSVWSMVFGKHLGLDRQELLVLATGALFIDVGKIRIRPHLLSKPAALDAQEVEEMRTHVEHGVTIVSGIDGIDPRIVDMVRYHHERHNGTGYPHGLAGADIPVFARIAGLIDAYDAMISERPYAKARSAYDAARELSRLSGVEFAAEVVEQFIQAIGVFPVGSLVELNTGEVGMVVAQNRVRRLRPKLILLLDRDKLPLDVYPIVDLRNPAFEAPAESALWIERGLAPGEYGIDPTEYYLRDF
jgi:HD-GYP domain-containing protein (c-di-GMP phosphodiesterase class II)